MAHDMNKTIDQLLKYTEFDNEGFSEDCIALIDFYNNRTVYYSKKLKKALKREIKENLKWYQDNTTIITFDAISENSILMMKVYQDDTE